MDRPAFADALINHPAFAGLPPQLAGTLLAASQPVLLPAGRVLFDQGAPCSGFLVIEKGSIRVTKSGATGREILLYRLRPGDSCILTVTCLLADATYSARGVVETDVSALAVPGPLFRKLLTDWPPFREFIFRFFAERVTELMARIEDVAFRALDQRVASALLAHCEPVEITHQRLADEVGSVREVVSRILKDLEARGYVRLERGRIHVLDREGLIRFAASVGDASH